MTDRTKIGISRSGIFSAIYCLPGFYAVARSVLQRTTPDEARALVTIALGGLGASILACTALLPALMRRLGYVDLAAVWRRAAFRAVGFGTVWTLMWTMLFVPLGAPGVRLAAGLAGSAAMLAILWWVDRRWPHLGFFERRWSEGRNNDR